MKNFDVLILGSGVAGLSTALHLADKAASIALICKGPLQEGSSYYAQGGIAAVLNEDDSIESHIEDTMNAGAGLCHRDAVEFTVTNAKSAIDWLIDLGVAFTRDNDNTYHLTKEGGHSARRIIHAEDATGKSVVGTLIDRVKAHANIQIFESHTAVDLLYQQEQCVGAYVYDEAQDKVETFGAKAVMLATGGASRVYLYSTNPAVSSGDGIAIAYRAGAKVANMEFNQFHPTCLYHPNAGSFLISEALRGEGAVLKLPDGERFMDRYHDKAELAPRDIVARAIDSEMKRLGVDCVYLDISHQDSKFVREHFPNIYERCLQLGIDITKEPIPVVPAAHYTCGGVMIDQNGRTSIAGLYAAGEVSSTGIHGANRMASNSLLECLVYAKSASEHIADNMLADSKLPNLPEWDESQVVDSDEEIVIKQNWDELRQLMWNYVGIVRSNKRLERARRRIELLKQEVFEYYGHFRVSKPLLELRNLILIGELIVESAMQRHESRGLHFNVDYPGLLASAEDTVVQRRWRQDGV